MFPPVAYNKTEICFADFFDPLILLRLHFIIIILFQTTFLQQTKASGGSDINSPYRMGMENLSAVPMKEDRSSSHMRYIVIVETG